MVEKRGEGRKQKGVYKEVTLVPLDEVIPYDKNPKKHPPEQIEKIAESIRSFGFDQPIVVDENMVIIKGHGRRLASQFLGLKRVPVVVRTDLTDAQARASRIADNQTAESYWDMSNLIYELETLYSMGGESSLEGTGYDFEEIRTILPGLLDTDTDYQVQNIEGIVPIDLSMTSPDGLVGKKVKSKKSLGDWVHDHDQIIILFNGNRADLAAVCWAIEQGIEPERLIIRDFTFGQRMWRWHDDYLSYIEDTLGVTVIRENRVYAEDYKTAIKEKGFPTEDKPWCCNVYKRKELKSVVPEHEGEKSVIIFGVTKEEDGTQIYRERGSLVDITLHYAAPFATGVDSDITEQIEKFDLKLNPVYKRTDQYLCPGCPYYKSPDYVFTKSHDLDLWIRWMVTLGRAQWNAKQLQDGTFNAQLIRMIGDGIDPREHGKYADYAQDLPECVQPIRDTIRVGDDYGWNEEDDAKLSDKGWIDKPRERWFEHEDYSKPYYHLEKVCAEVAADIKEKGREQHMEEVIAKAKAEAELQGEDQEDEITTDAVREE